MSYELFNGKSFLLPGKRYGKEAPLAREAGAKWSIAGNGWNFPLTHKENMEEFIKKRDEIYALDRQRLFPVKKVETPSSPSTEEEHPPSSVDSKKSAQPETPPPPPSSSPSSSEVSEQSSTISSDDDSDGNLRIFTYQPSKYKLYMSNNKDTYSSESEYSDSDSDSDY